MGIALGGTGAVLASGVTALARGAAMGISTAATPTPALPTESTPTLRKSFSADVLPTMNLENEEDEQECLKCAGINFRTVLCIYVRINLK